MVVEEEPPPPPPPLPRQYYEQIKVPPPWGKTVDPLAENASKDDKQQWKRNNIVNELMQTEIDYERDLAVIVGVRDGTHFAHKHTGLLRWGMGNRSS